MILYLKKIIPLTSSHSFSDLSIPLIISPHLPLYFTNPLSLSLPLHIDFIKITIFILCYNYHSINKFHLCIQARVSITQVSSAPILFYILNIWKYTISRCKGISSRAPLWMRKSVKEEVLAWEVVCCIGRVEYRSEFLSACWYILEMYEDEKSLMSLLTSFHANFIHVFSNSYDG